MKRNLHIISIFMLLVILTYSFINFFTNYDRRVTMMLGIPIENMEVLARQKIDNYTSTVAVDKIKQDYYLFLSTDKHYLDLAYKKIQNEKVSLYYYKPDYERDSNTGYCVIAALNPNRTPYNIKIYDYDDNLIFTYMMSNHTVFLKSISMNPHEFAMLKLKLIKNSEDITTNNANIIN